MNPKLTGEAYDQITHRWMRDTFNNKNGIDQHKRAMAFVESFGIALDVGCGCNSRFLEYLTRKGFVYEGLDVSEEMISLARKQNPDVVFHHEDICEWENTQKYDFITVWDSIWHVPLEMQEHVIFKLVSTLNPNGVLIFSFGGTEEPGEHTNELMGPIVYYSTLGSNAYFQLVSKMGCVIRHFEFDQYPEPHAFIIAQKNA